MIIFEPKERYSAALIGAGRIGLLLESDAKRRKPATHAGMWAHHGRFDLAAVCDSEEGRFDAARAVAPNVACYTDAAEMISAVKPDVVSIATWRDSHHAMMKLALDHGAPAIICEKPIAERR